MTSDQLSAAQKDAFDYFPGSSRGWGFGVSIEAVSERYGWDGGYGASWTSPSPPPVNLDFWTSAYQSIDD